MINIQFKRKMLNCACHDYAAIACAQYQGRSRLTVNSKWKRNGLSFAELIVSIALITLLFGLVAQINISISNAVLRNKLHLAASEELDNIIEQIAAAPYDQITSEAADKLDFIRTQNRLSDWDLTIVATETKDHLPTKRIEVALTSPQTLQISAKRMYWKTNVTDKPTTEESP